MPQAADLLLLEVDAITVIWGFMILTLISRGSGLFWGVDGSLHDACISVATGQIFPFCPFRPWSSSTITLRSLEASSLDTGPRNSQKLNPESYQHTGGVRRQRMVSLSNTALS